MLRCSVDDDDDEEEEADTKLLKSGVLRFLKNLQNTVKL